MECIHSQFDMIHLFWEAICLLYENKRSALLCCVVFSGDLLCYSSLSMLTMRHCRSRKALSLFWYGASCVHVWPDNNGKSFFSCYSQAIIDKTVWSKVSFTERLIVKFPSHASEGALWSVQTSPQYWPLWMNWIKLFLLHVSWAETSQDTAGRRWGWICSVTAELICTAVQRSARLLSLLFKRSRIISVWQEILFCKVSNSWGNFYIPEAWASHSLKAVFFLRC